jgi:hypothetical protein
MLMVYLGPSSEPADPLELSIPIRLIEGGKLGVGSGDERTLLNDSFVLRLSHVQNDPRAGLTSSNAQMR